MLKITMLRVAAILRFLGSVFMRCWAWSGASILGCVLLYWAYGGFMALILLCIAITGKNTNIYLIFYVHMYEEISHVDDFISGIIYHTEDQLVFHPEQPSHSRVFVPVPSMYGLAYENLYVRSNDGTLLHLFFIRQPPHKASMVPTIVFLHGNAGNMGHRYVPILQNFENSSCRVLVIYLYLR
jgi:hypothetical protein